MANGKWIRSSDMLNHVPLLPEEQTIPSGATFNAISRLLRFIDTDTPHSLQIKCNPQGGLRLSVANASSGYAPSYDGPFSMQITESGVSVTGGWVNRNGNFFAVGGAILPLRKGQVCVHTQLSGSGEWSAPSIVYHSPDLWHYPIGHVGYSDDWDVTCYRVPVAVFLATEACPLARTDS